MSVMNKGLQQHILEKRLKQQGIKPDLIDTEAWLDNSLTLPENIENFSQQGFIQPCFDMMSTDEEQYRNHRKKYYTCKNCGSTCLEIKKFRDNWVIVKCSCGYWNGFKDNTQFT